MVTFWTSFRTILEAIAGVKIGSKRGLKVGLVLEPSSSASQECRSRQNGKLTRRVKNGKLLGIYSAKERGDQAFKGLLRPLRAL